MPSSGHCGGHHAAGKDTRPSLLCPDVDGTVTGRAHYRASSLSLRSTCQKGGWPEQAKQCPPGGIAMLSHCPAFQAVGTAGTASAPASLEQRSHTAAEKALVEILSLT